MTDMPEQRNGYTIYSDEETAAAKAAMTRIQNWLKADATIEDENHMVIYADALIEDMTQFIRDNLDLKGGGLSDCAYDSLLTEPGAALAQRVLDDLALIWGYDFYRDELSHIAMTMSLCPLHFCDWQACFDDDVAECSQIRAIFPNSHDT